MKKSMTFNTLFSYASLRKKGKVKKLSTNHIALFKKVSVRK